MRGTPIPGTAITGAGWTAGSWATIDDITQANPGVVTTHTAHGFQNGDTIYFTGVKGIPNQDIVMWESMGPITDRTKERVGASDFAVVEFRRLMVEAARQFQKDGTVIGRTEPHIPHVKIASYEGMMPKSADWRTFGIAQDETIIAAE